LITGAIILPNFRQLKLFLLVLFIVHILFGSFLLAHHAAGIFQGKRDRHPVAYYFIFDKNCRITG
jgi:hypothetical protein